MIKVFKKGYDKICNFLSIKNITWISLGIFVITMLPIFYLSFMNRASGDDYSYGTYTRAAWMATHSLWEVIKASWRTIVQYYYGWQGTWFDIFLFTIQPEVFSDKAYFIVVFLILFLWFGTTVLLFKEIFVKRLELDKWSFGFITIIFLMINVQFVPSTKSAIFWFNGCAHYMIPFAMCQFLAFLLLKYIQDYKIKYWMGIFIIMTLLGGANYQAALFGIIIAFYLGIAEYVINRNKKVFWLLVPAAAEMIGLIISFKAPGNKARGGEDFGFSVGLVIETVLDSFITAIKDIGVYFQNKPIVFIGLFMIFLVLLENAKRNTKKENVVWNFIVVLAMFCLYSAMQAPAIYAGVEVSGGVYNMNYQCFLLMMLTALYVLAGIIGNCMKKITAESIHKNLLIPGFVICCFLLILCRSNIKDSTTWICMDYITSGQAADYKEQMDIQTRLMLDENATDVVVPFINNEQGPLMHMPVTDDKKAWSNTVTSQFYGKNSVVAIERPLWESMQKED